MHLYNIATSSYLIIPLSQKPDWYAYVISKQLLLVSSGVSMK